MRSILINITRPSTELLWPFNLPKLSTLSLRRQCYPPEDHFTEDQQYWIQSIPAIVSANSLPIFRELKEANRFDSPIRELPQLPKIITICTMWISAKGLLSDQTRSSRGNILNCRAGFFLVYIVYWAVKLNLFVDRAAIRSDLSSLSGLIDRIAPINDFG